MDYSLRMVEDAVPGKHINEMEERRQELIGESILSFGLILLFAVDY